MKTRNTSPSTQLPANSPETGFRSHDLFLGAYLLAKGAKLLGHTRSGSRVTFIFADDGNLQTLIRDFWNDDTVNTQAFIQAQQTLKSIIFG